MLQRAAARCRPLVVSDPTWSGARRRRYGGAPSPCTLEGEPSGRTLAILKHDTLQRALLGEITQRFERRGLKLIGLKLTRPTRALVEEHYAQLVGKPYFERACLILGSGPVVAAVWEGRGVVGAVRQLVGPTDPLDGRPGTIRFDFGSHWRRNLIHASDDADAAAREIRLWFAADEICAWEQACAPWIYELPNAPTSDAI